MTTLITTTKDHTFTVGDTIEIPMSRLLGPPIQGGAFVDERNERYVITSVDSTTLTISEPRWYDHIRWWFQGVIWDAVNLWWDIQEARCEPER